MPNVQVVSLVLTLRLFTMTVCHEWSILLCYSCMRVSLCCARCCVVRAVMLDLLVNCSGAPSHGCLHLGPVRQTATYATVGHGCPELALAYLWRMRCSTSLNAMRFLLAPVIVQILACRLLKPVHYDLAWLDKTQADPRLRLVLIVAAAAA